MQARAFNSKFIARVPKRCDKETIEEEQRIRHKEDCQLQQMDLLNFAAAIRHKAIAFVTLDSDFTENTASKFGIKIINLKKF